MPGAKLRYPGEPFEILIRRYNRAVEKSGLLQEVRRREAYEKPSITKKQAKQAAIRRQRVRSEIEKMQATKEGRQKLKVLAKKREKQEEKQRKMREEREAR